MSKADTLKALQELIEGFERLDMWLDRLDDECKRLKECKKV